MKVLHIINGLGDGGAEATLFKLCKNTPTINHFVIALSYGDKYFSLLADLGIPVLRVNLRRRRDFFDSFRQIIRFILISQPDLIQSWLYHSDIVGGVIGKILGIKVIWSIHNNDVSAKTLRFSTFVLVRVNSLLSYVLPSSIVFCSVSALNTHRGLGYSPNKCTVIHNGYDVRKYPLLSPSPLKEYSNLPQPFVFGMVARWHPVKDHATLIQALSILNVLTCEPWICMLVGSQVLKTNDKLVSQIKAFGIESKILLLGQSSHVSSIMEHFHINILTSLSESFPNVICEAMALGVPSVATDVGDISKIVGESGWIVTTRSPLMLAQTLFESMQESHSDYVNRRILAHSLVSFKYNISLMCQGYESLYAELAKQNFS